PPLSCIADSGVTREFIDLFGTIGAPDFSEACLRSLRLTPSRGCPPSSRLGTSEISRFPCREQVRACRVLRPREDDSARTHSIGQLCMAFRYWEYVGSSIQQIFEAQYPGPLARPPTLRPRGHPRQRKDWPSQGWVSPGVGLADSFLGFHHLLLLTYYSLPVSRRSPHPSRYARRPPPDRRYAPMGEVPGFRVGGQVRVPGAARASTPCAFAAPCDTGALPHGALLPESDRGRGRGLLAEGEPLVPGKLAVTFYWTGEQASCILVFLLRRACALRGARS